MSNQLITRAALLAIVLAPGCKTSQSALEAAIDPTTRPAWVKAVLPPDGFEAYLPSGQANAAVPASLQGIWWFRSDPNQEMSMPTGVNVLGAASWESDARALLVPRFGYGFAMNAGKGQVGAALANFTAASEEGERRDLIFATDFTSAEDHRFFHGNRWERPDTLLNKVSTTEWAAKERQTSGSVIRLVAPDGTRDKAYADFVQAFGSGIEVMFPAKVFDVGRRLLDIQVPSGAAGTFVQLIKPGADRMAAFVVTAESDFPLALTFHTDKMPAAGSDLDGKRVAGVMNNASPGVLWVRSKGPAGGKVRLTIEDTKLVTLTERTTALAVHVAPGIASPVQLNVPVMKAGLYQVTIAPGSVPATLSATPEKSYPGKYLTFVDQSSSYIFVNPTGEGGTVTLSMTQLPRPVVDHGTLAPDAAAPTGTFSSIGAVEAYHVGRAVWRASSNGPCCAASAEVPDQPISLQIAGRNPIGPIEQNDSTRGVNGDKILIVGYTGDLNDPSPPLDFQVKKMETNVGFPFCYSNGGQGLGEKSPCRFWSTNIFCTKDDEQPLSDRNRCVIKPRP